ncbi:MAG TPA: GTP cyclohydrolase I, partial [Pyrinomonadaceae bacterium]|nr:GTP cyclohydrolase I [Pyrinomonadaceae bacterium]
MATRFSATEPDDNSVDDAASRSVDLEKIERGIRLVLEGVGEDPERPGLLKTPQRVAEMYAELTEGMREDPRAHVDALPGDKH